MVGVSPMGNPWSMAARVLVVDDDGGLREALAEVLRQEGFDPLCARDGHEALAHLHRGERPLVILLDLSMPVMDGERFRAEQLKVPGGASIPVVLVSSHDDAARTARRLALPYLAKPFEVDALLDAVGRCRAAQ